MSSIIQAVAETLVSSIAANSGKGYDTCMTSGRSWQVMAGQKVSSLLVSKVGTSVCYPRALGHAIQSQRYVCCFCEASGCPEEASDSVAHRRCIHLRWLRDFGSFWKAWRMAWKWSSRPHRSQPENDSENRRSFRCFRAATCTPYLSLLSS